MQSERSASLYEKACRVLVGGVNSPVRAFSAVGGHPFFVASGAGGRIIDVDGNELIDYVLSWGPLILGHAHPAVVDALKAAVERGSSFGIPTEAEIRLAERIVRHFPSIEKLRLVNSGTEAAMSAIRLARGYTRRDLVVKMEGCYHGHADGLLVKAGSGLTTLGVPTSPGVPEAYASRTLTIPFNDLDAARDIVGRYGNDLACVLLEPVAGNMGVIVPKPGYLEGLRTLTSECGALLVFDEVMTGFRVAMGGAQARFRVQPDLTVLGKVIGGGLPMGAFGGPASIMDHLAPVGPVYQAGTLSGNPLATAAGLATLTELERPGVFDAAKRSLAALSQGLADIAQEAGVAVYQTKAGTMGCLFFHDGPVSDYSDATAADTALYARFFRAMLARGVYFAPSQFEACFTSSAHTDDDVARTLEAARTVFRRL